MSVTVKIFTKHVGRPTLFQTREFEALPVTLGRDATCTVALDDPMKHISRVHVQLEEEDGSYWLSVVSKVNPVMVKGKRHGPGSRLMLQSGDSFDMGEFEVQVVFTDRKRATPASAPAASEPPAPPPTVAPHEKKSLIDMLAAEDESAEALPKDLPPPEPGLFDEPTFIGGDEPTYMGPAGGLAPKPAAPAEKPKTQLEATTRRGTADASSMPDAVRVFLEGAGAPARPMTPEQGETLLRESGAVLRAAVEGLRMLLVARGEMRKEFDAERHAMAAARDGNPLERMADAQQAIDFLLDPAQRSQSSLAPVQAIADAAEDLRTHELALMAGMRAAVLSAVRRFDPQVLEKAFGKSASGFSLGGRKARMWELFVTHQQNLAREGEEDFFKAFGRDFLAAYESQLRRLKTPR